MRNLFLILVGALALSACANLDEYLPRETQCVLLDVAKQAAVAKGVDIDTYLNTNQLFVCAEVDGNALKVAE